MGSIPLVLRIHAMASVFPMCEAPQALGIGIDGETGEMLIYRISGECRTLIDTGSVLSIWSRWLPVTWGIQSIVNASTMGLHDDSKWSCVLGKNASVNLTTPNCGPPITLTARELEAGMLIMGGPLVQKDLSSVEFPEHPLDENVPRVTRHNHRIHQIAQEVEEIEL